MPAFDGLCCVDGVSLISMFGISLCKVSQEETALGFRRTGLGLQPTHTQATSDRIVELLTFLVFAL